MHFTAELKAYWLSYSVICKMVWALYLDHSRHAVKHICTMLEAYLISGHMPVI